MSSQTSFKQSWVGKRWSGFQKSRKQTQARKASHTAALQASHARAKAQVPTVPAAAPVAAPATFGEKSGSHIQSTHRAFQERMGFESDPVVDDWFVNKHAAIATLETLPGVEDSQAAEHIFNEIIAQMQNEFREVENLCETDETPERAEQHRRTIRQKWAYSDAAVRDFGERASWRA